MINKQNNRINKQLELDLSNIKYNQLSQEDERKYIFQFQSGSTEQEKDKAGEILMNSYLRNIIYLITKYNTIIDYNDILSECIFSLKKSLSNYNLKTHNTPFVLFYKQNIIHTINALLNKENKYNKLEINIIFR